MARGLKYLWREEDYVSFAGAIRLRGSGQEKGRITSLRSWSVQVGSGQRAAAFGSHFIFFGLH